MRRQQQQKTLRHTSDASSTGTGPTNSPGTVWKKLLLERSAQMVRGRLTARRTSSTATARRELDWPNARLPHRRLPAAVQKSQEASMTPSEISLPLKTTISSRMRTTWPMTALNPTSIRAAPAECCKPCVWQATTEWRCVFIRTKLESSRPQNTRTARYSPKLEPFCGC
jgi:hypothetical protein